MLGTLKSESLKLKNSFSFYLILTFFLLEILTILPYLWLIPQGISLQNLAFFTMLALPLLCSLLAILGFEQEKQANHFQEIRSFKSQSQVYLAKLLLLDALLIFPAGLFWLLSGHGNLSFVLALAGSLLVIFLFHFHFLLSFFVNKAGNLLIAFIECLFIIFASNFVFLRVYWLPQVLPINFILKGNLWQILILLAWIFLLTLLSLLILRRKKF